MTDTFFIFFRCLALDFWLVFLAALHLGDWKGRVLVGKLDGRGLWIFVSLDGRGGGIGDSGCQDWK